MNTFDLPSDGFADDRDNGDSSQSQSQRVTALSSKITSILSTPYTDAEIREAFVLLDGRKVQNTAETRRRLRVDAQKDVLDCNGAIVRDFAKVADVCMP